MRGRYLFHVFLPPGYALVGQRRLVLLPWLPGGSRALASHRSPCLLPAAQPALPTRSSLECKTVLCELTVRKIQSNVWLKHASAFGSVLQQEGSPRFPEEEVRWFPARADCCSRARQQAWAAALTTACLRWDTVANSQVQRSRSWLLNEKWGATSKSGERNNGVSVSSNSFGWGKEP